LGENARFLGLLPFFAWCKLVVGTWLGSFVVTIYDFNVIQINNLVKFSKKNSIFSPKNLSEKLPFSRICSKRDKNKVKWIDLIIIWEVIFCWNLGRVNFYGVWVSFWLCKVSLCRCIQEDLGRIVGFCMHFLRRLGLKVWLGSPFHSLSFCILEYQS
jgi:hypothetical protein